MCKILKYIRTRPAYIEGFRNLVFESDFSSENQIDINTTGKPGYQWYTDRPNGWPPLQSSEISLNNGIITINPSRTQYNWQLSTYSTKGKTGSTFRFGYFEAKMRFEPKLEVKSDGWPSFWAESKNHMEKFTEPHFAELDFFEMIKGEFHGTLHDWIYSSNGYLNVQNTNSRAAFPQGEDLSQWHTYGTLWKPGSVTWYFDGKALFTQTYSANGVPDPSAVTKSGTYNDAGTFSILDSDPQAIVIGTGVNWPLQVKWVRVWQ